MARLTIDDAALRLELNRWERVFGMHGDIEVPAASVVATEDVDNAWPHLHGFRWPGTGVPDLVCLGTLRHAGRRDFTVVYGRGPARIVHLEGAAFHRIIVSGQNG